MQQTEHSALVELELEYQTVDQRLRQPVDNAVMLVVIVVVVVIERSIDDIAAVDGLERIAHERLLEF